MPRIETVTKQPSEVIEAPSTPVKLNKNQIEAEKKLKSDVLESPNSKNKYKLISRDLKELEKTTCFEKLV